MINEIINIIVITLISFMMVKYNNDNQGIFILRNPWLDKMKNISAYSEFNETEKNKIIEQLNILSHNLLEKKRKYKYLLLFLYVILFVDSLSDIYLYYVRNSFFYTIHNTVYNIYMPIFILFFFYFLISENKFLKKQCKIWNDYTSKWNEEHPSIKIQ